MKDADIIFKDTVASLFPEIGKEKTKPPIDPYAGGDQMADSLARYEKYLNIAEEAVEFVESNPYVYRFNWKRVLDSKIFSFNLQNIIKS